MAKLTTAARKRIPRSNFAVPSKAPGSGSYPIPDRSHAQNALARASGKPVEAQVRRAVARKFPGFTGPPNGRGMKSEPGMAARAGMRQGSPNCTFCGKKHPGYGEHKVAMYGSQVKKGAMQGSMQDPNLGQ